MSRRSGLPAFLIGLTGYLLAVPGFSATWHISPDGTGDAPTIQAGIDAAADGDVLELAAGTFVGAGNRDIDFLGKEVTVRSESGDPATCVIDCQGSDVDPHRGFIFRSGEGPASVLENLTIRGGFAPLDPLPRGGAIYCETGCSPTVSGCVLEGNFAREGGGGMECRPGASPSIEGCVFRGNSTGPGEGGGLELLDPDVTCVVTGCRFESNFSEVGGGASCGGAASFVDCDFVENTAGQVAGGLRFTSVGGVSGCSFVGNQAQFGGGLGTASVSLTLEYCVFFENSADFGGAIFSAHSGLPLQITNCSLVRNSAGSGAGLFAMSAAAHTIENTVIAFSTSGEAVACFTEGGPIVVCSDIFANSGGDWTGCLTGQEGVNDNFSADPLFCDLVTGDLTLREGSPCLPGASPCSALVGAEDFGCGGPVSAGSQIELVSWGAIKARYRSGP